MPRCAWRATGYPGANGLTKGSKIRCAGTTARREARVVELPEKRQRETTTAAPMDTLGSSTNKTQNQTQCLTTFQSRPTARPNHSAPTLPRWDSSDWYSYRDRAQSIPQRIAWLAQTWKARRNNASRTCRPYSRRQDPVCSTYCAAVCF